MQSRISSIILLVSTLAKILEETSKNMAETPGQTERFERPPGEEEKISIKLLPRTGTPARECTAPTPASSRGTPYSTPCFVPGQHSSYEDVNALLNPCASASLLQPMTFDPPSIFLPPISPCGPPLPFEKPISWLDPPMNCTGGKEQEPALLPIPPPPPPPHPQTTTSFFTTDHRTPTASFTLVICSTKS